MIPNLGLVRQVLVNLQSEYVGWPYEANTGHEAKPNEGLERLDVGGISWTKTIEPSLEGG